MSHCVNAKGSEEIPVRREDVGASAGGQSSGLCQPDKGVRPLGDFSSSLLPASLSFTPPDS